MEWRVPLADLDYGPEEDEAVLKVLKSRWLTMGGVTQDFEARFAAELDARHAVAVSNATEALHLALLALGIGPGDEVIVPSLSFVATANVVLYTGAEVHFAEVIGPDDLTIDPEHMESLITDRTRAVIPMHYAGYPCRMEGILDIATRHHLSVVEDAAHAPGASLNGRAVGRWSDIGCFSFFSNKNLSTGEGGMLVTDQDALTERLRILRSHGMTSLTWDRHKGHAYSYDVVDLGYNYRIDEIRAALGIVQLGKLKANNARREEITHRYWQELENTALELPFCSLESQPDYASAYHIFPVLLPEGTDRKAFMDAMRSAGVQTSIHYPPIHQFTYYRQRYPGVSLPHTEALAAREVTLPLYPGMTDVEIEIVVQAVRSALEMLHI